VKPGKLEILDIDDTFCAAHGTQQLAFWNAHHDERGFASMHIYHVTSGTPVVAILRAARTPKGTEVRTVIKHVTKRLRTHWPNTRIVWRGDSHYGRVEAMEWAEDDGVDYIFGLADNTTLDALVAENADNFGKFRIWCTSRETRPPPPIINDMSSFLGARLGAILHTQLSAESFYVSSAHLGSTIRRNRSGAGRNAECQCFPVGHTSR
jgi:hypothetical protein